jgi:hypothetical protein
MYNSTFKNPGKGLTRSAFKPKADAKPLHRSNGISAKPKADPKPSKLRNFEKSKVPAAPKPRSTLTSRRPPTSKIRQSARDEYCRLRLPGVCKTEPGNVVWAHSNRGEHGKGGGLKADDEYGAYACYWCHCVYDRQHPRPPGMTLEFVEDRFTVAMTESRAALQAKGLLTASAPGAMPTQL